MMSATSTYISLFLVFSGAAFLEVDDYHVRVSFLSHPTEWRLAQFHGNLCEEKPETELRLVAPCTLARCRRGCGTWFRLPVSAEHNLAGAVKMPPTFWPSLPDPNGPVSPGARALSEQLDKALTGSA
jgi:hypothetical protein